jgi:hypothetical protein
MQPTSYSTSKSSLSLDFRKTFSGCSSSAIAVFGRRMAGEEVSHDKKQRKAPSGVASGKTVSEREFKEDQAVMVPRPYI